MRIHLFRSMVFFSVVFLFFSSFFVTVSLSRVVNNRPLDSLFMDTGQILYAPLWTTTTYLLDCTGVVNHSWVSIYFPGVAVRWLGDGMILRTVRAGLGPPTGGVGGGVQKVNWDGTIVWDFLFNSDNYCSHHDAKVLPNGNVLLIAWEKKTRNEAISAGRNPDFVSNLQGFMPDFIVEVKPTGPTTGDIVWEWHVWDHLIQDFDSTKANFGIVEEHPELVDINYQVSSTDDWMHTNSIDYNEDFDQILLSVCFFNEIWVIDHSTTTEEASGHTGGNSGKGGDLLYRWGNPQAYREGNINDQKLFHQHDASWIDKGYPGEGNILVFNNGNNRPGGSYTSVDEIDPPVNEDGVYYIENDGKYGPETKLWTYTANPSDSFYVSHLGGAQRLPSGNTLITNGETGKIFEVNSDKTTVWQYNTGGQVFRAEYIPPLKSTESNLDCEGSLNWINVNPGVTLNSNFFIKNIGKNNSNLDWKILSYPDWGTWYFNPKSGEGLKPEDGSLNIQVSVIIPNDKNKEFNGYIKVVNQDDLEDFDVIPINLKITRNTNIRFFAVLDKIIDNFSILKLFI